MNVDKGLGLRNNNHLLTHSMIYQDTANSNTVYAYFQDCLPKLTTPSVIILDNVSYYKSKQLEDLFNRHNHKLIFLPAYSPDLNPIEQLWGTIKQQLRNYYDYSLALYENLSLAVCKYCV